MPTENDWKVRSAGFESKGPEDTLSLLGGLYTYLTDYQRALKRSFLETQSAASKIEETAKLTREHYGYGSLGMLKTLPGLLKFHTLLEGSEQDQRNMLKLVETAIRELEVEMSDLRQYIAQQER